MYHNVPSVFKFSMDASEPVVHLEKGCMFKIQAQDTLKVADSFEVETVAYHVCYHLLSYNLKDGFKAVDKWLRGDRDAVEPDEVTRGVIDRVYEESLAFVEFVLNRLTAYSDDSMEQFMVGVRFSLCYYLRMDRSRMAAHTRPTAGNTILFRQKDVASIVTLDHVALKGALKPKSLYSYDEILEAFRDKNAVKYREVVSFYDVVRNTVSRDYVDKPAIYVEIQSDSPFTESLVSECWQSVRPGTTTTSRGAFVPLMEVLGRMEAFCASEPVFWYQVESDYADMCADILVANSALLGFVGKRDTSLNYGSIHVSELPRRYCAPDGVDMLKHCLLVSRVIDCIIIGSGFEKNGSNGALNLRFTARSMVRMMDSEIFGRAVYQPNIVFVNKSRTPMEDYEQYLQSLGFVEDDAHHGHSFIKIVDDLQSMEMEWGASDRVRAKPKGCFGHIRSVSHVTMGELVSKDLNKFRNGTILVCDADQKSDVIRAVRNAVHSKGADKDRVWRVVVLLNDAIAHREYTMVDARDGNIVEVGLSGSARLFDTHTNGIVVRTLVALNSALSSMCEAYSVPDGDTEALDAALTGSDMGTAVKREFLRFYRGMSSEIEMMNSTSAS